MEIISIKLTEDQRQYLINGQPYSRISDIAGSGDTPWLDQWRKRVGEEEANRIAAETAWYGEAVHEITMWDDMGKKRQVEKVLKSHPTIKDALFLSLLAWRNWVGSVVKKWVVIEKVVWSERWRCAGRIDRVPWIIRDVAPSIVDLKTGGLWDKIGVQLAGYREVYNEKAKVKVGRRIAVSLPRKEPGKLVLKEYSEQKYIEEFISKAELFKSMNR